MSTGVVLLAAGSGHRFGGRTPKQFLPLKGEPLFVKSLRVFGSVPSVKEIVLVAPPGRARQLTRRVPRLPGRIALSVVDGGSFRGASVRNGVKALSPRVRIILVHDAARPMVTADIVRRVEAAARRTGSALAAWPLADTIKVGNGRRVRKTIPRAGLWLAQTPQGFRRDVAYKCLMNPRKNATDDVALAEARRLPVELVEGSPTNIKITTPDDLRLCRALLS
jgi:2-C-methyl-D-erythritol 4-phosphate cytidylyltransferase